MKNINTFFKAIFDTNEIADGGLLHFTCDHIENLQKHNMDGKYDHLIKSTSFLYRRFLDAYQQKKEVGSVKMKQTQEVDLMLEQAKEEIRKLAAYIRAFYDKESEIYTCFFPEGLSEYSRITKSNINHLMSRIFLAAEKYEDQIDTQIINNVIKTEQLYQAKRNKQLKQKYAFKSNIENKNKLRKQLARQLQINLFELAKEYIGEPQKEASFFDSSLLELKRFNPERFHKSKNEMKWADRTSKFALNSAVPGILNILALITLNIYLSGLSEFFELF